MTTLVNSFSELAHQSEELGLRVQPEPVGTDQTEKTAPDRGVEFPERNRGSQPTSQGRPRRKRLALLVDVANSEELDFGAILEQARQLGQVAEAKAYGDFRQHHMTDHAGTLYGLGFELVHCPSWPNGATNGDGSRKWKRTDDVLMQRGAMGLLINQPSIDTYVFVTADADIIPACHTLRERGKRVVLIYTRGCLGLIFRKCPFELIPITPREKTPRSTETPLSINGGIPPEAAAEPPDVLDRLLQVVDAQQGENINQIQRNILPEN